MILSDYSILIQDYVNTHKLLLPQLLENQFGKLSLYQLGPNLANKLKTKVAIIISSSVCIVGLIVMYVTTITNAHYIYLTPGMIIASVGQGSVWTLMWIAAGSGVAVILPKGNSIRCQND
jgi:Na+/melibiose symporter-like transporter